MAFRLPAATNPLRALFDLEHLAKIGTRELVVTTYDAEQSARRVFAADTGVQSVNAIVVHSNALTQLICFERNRDHYKVLWNFGPAWEIIKI